MKDLVLSSTDGSVTFFLNERQHSQLVFENYPILDWVEIDEDLSIGEFPIQDLQKIKSLLSMS